MYVFVHDLIRYSPASPDEMDWSTHYPKFFNEEEDAAGKSKDGKQVEWADVGCGFGGLLMSLAPQFPDTLMLGMSPCSL
jgi:tRNA (guanine-N7-)-methyltransferase